MIEYLFCDSANVCTYIHLKFQRLIKNNDRFGLSIILVIDEFDQQKRIEKRGREIEKCKRVQLLFNFVSFGVPSKKSFISYRSSIYNKLLGLLLNFYITIWSNLFWCVMYLFPISKIVKKCLVCSYTIGTHTNLMMQNALLREQNILCIRF